MNLRELSYEVFKLKKLNPNGVELQWIKEVIEAVDIADGECCFISNHPLWQKIRASSGDQSKDVSKFSKSCKILNTLKHRIKS